MVNIMPKNWLICEETILYYIDLILFQPKGKLLEQINELSAKMT